MVDFLSPEVIIQEEASAAVPVLASSTSTSWMEATATRGPINRSLIVTGLQDWESIYGKDDGGFGRQSAVGFFNNGGRLLFYNRVDHYDDITDRATLDPDASETTFFTLGNAAGVATKTTDAGPWDLSIENGVVAPVELIATIDATAPDTATFAATPSILTAAGVSTGAGTPGDTLVFTLNGVAITYTVPGSVPNTAADWALSIAAQVPGASFIDVVGVVTGVSDRLGSSASLDYTSGTGSAGANSGFGVGPTSGVNAGPNDVADLAAVTPAEVKTVLEADWSGGGGVLVTPQPDDSLVITTLTSGVAASISTVTGSAEPEFNFDPAGLAIGEASGSPSVATLKLIATSEGAHGNSLGVTVVRKDRVISTVATDIPFAPITEFFINETGQLRIGMQIFIEDTVTTGMVRAVVSQVIGTRVILKSAVTPTAVITAANSPTVTKETFDVTFIIDNDNLQPFSDLSMDDTDVKFFVGNVIGTDPTALNPRQRMYVELQGAPLSNDQDPRPLNATNQALAGGTDTSIALVDLDYIGSASTNTGLRAADAVEGQFSLLAVPGIELDSVHRAIQDYAELQKSHLALINTPAGFTPSQAKDYIQITANLFSTYVAAYAGELVVLRESTGAREEFPSIGYLLGVYARSDRTDSVASPPAGVRKGQVSGVIGAGTENQYASKANRDLIYPDPGINTVWSKIGSGIVAWGQLTLDPNSDRGTIGVRRALLALERDIERISDFVLFELNTEELRQDYKTRVGGYLRSQWLAKIIQGSSENEAFFIKCDEENNPPTAVNSRQFFAEIHVNVIPAIDYAIITIRRDTRALEAELAAA